MSAWDLETSTKDVKIYVNGVEHIVNADAGFESTLHGLATAAGLKQITVKIDGCETDVEDFPNNFDCIDVVTVAKYDAGA